MRDNELKTLMIGYAFDVMNQVYVRKIFEIDFSVNNAYTAFIYLPYYVLWKIVFCL